MKAVLCLLPYMSKPNTYVHVSGVFRLVLALAQFYLICSSTLFHDFPKLVVCYSIYDDLCFDLDLRNICHACVSRNWGGFYFGQNGYQ